ncbi:MAG TPA: acetyl-CoA C-acyltransferase [Anaerolineales bacterium]|nr:acetyl-CoA C-acyltransferase [Anaerolineales bacterium]
MTREAVIVEAVRTPVGRAARGTTRDVRPDDLAASVIMELLRRTKGKLDPAEIDDFILGCAFPEGDQGLNMARPVAVRAGLPVEVPAMTINRFCSSGLQAIAIAAERIIANGADSIIAGGVESMSAVPMTGFAFSPNPWLTENAPEVYMNMGLTAERVAEAYEVTRQAQDEFSYHSHRKAAEAVADGRFDDQLLPIEFEEVRLEDDGTVVREDRRLDVDEHLRADTTVEKLAKLKPAFKQNGTVTAGNSSPLSDGAAGVIVMEAGRAAALGLKPMARYVGFHAAGVRPEIMGIGPVAAVPRLLKRLGMKLGDIDVVELNEAFAAQAVAVVRELDLNPEIVNVNGGAIALGHPLGCTGAKLTTQVLYEMKRRKAKMGMVTMCIGGGMGAAGVFENLN